MAGDKKTKKDSENKVLSFVEKRKQNVELKRRQFERIMFDNLLGCYSVLDQGGAMHPIQLVDISYDGCLFQVPWNFERDKKFERDDEVTFKMFFTKHSYIPVVVNVKYTKEFIDTDGKTYMQYGCEFNQDMPSFEALKSFIDFMYKFAEFSSIDKSNHKVYFF